MGVSALLLQCSRQHASASLFCFPLAAETADGIGMLGGHHTSILWDGLSARSADGLRVVTEITGSGQAVRWTVCATAQEDEGQNPEQLHIQQGTQQDDDRQQENCQDAVLSPISSTHELQVTQQLLNDAGDPTPRP